MDQTITDLQEIFLKIDKIITDKLFIRKKYIKIYIN